MHHTATSTPSNSYTVKPRLTAPRFTANPDIPRPFPFAQIGLTYIMLTKQNPDLLRTPIYRGYFLAPKHRGKSGFYCNTINSTIQIMYYDGNRCQYKTFTRLPLVVSNSEEHTNSFAPINLRIEVASVKQSRRLNGYLTHCNFLTV